MGVGRTWPGDDDYVPAPGELVFVAAKRLANSPANAVTLDGIPHPPTDTQPHPRPIQVVGHAIHSEPLIAHLAVPRVHQQIVAASCQSLRSP